MVVVKTPSEGKPSMGKSIRNLSTVTRVGLDLAKRVFQVHVVEAKGEIVVARKLTRSQLIPFFAELPPCVVALEACSSAHTTRSKSPQLEATAYKCGLFRGIYLLYNHLTCIIFERDDNERRR
jgi:hypothetical protein